MTCDLPPQAIKRIAKELQDLQQQPCEGIRLVVNEQNLTDLQAELDGPAGTPYEGGLFRMRLTCGSDFPNSPPKGFFMTKIFHPNVSKTGEICVNVLKKDWTPEMGLRHVLMVIRCLLIQPFPDSALNEEAGKLLLENYEDFAKHAKLMTGIHAQPPKRHTPLTTSGANVGGQQQQHTAATAAGKDAVGVSSPKKPKPENKLAGVQAAKVKKSLKRL